MSSGKTGPAAEVVNAFHLVGEVESVEPFGSGHINDTFLITTNQDVKYLLQRINHRVFTDVAGLMRNMQLVTQHLREKLDEDISHQFTTPEIIPTRDGKLYYQASDDYWRVLSYIPNSVSYDLVTSEEQAFQAGYGFGYFQKLLNDLPADFLAITIPDFHNMESRFQKFHRAISEDAVGRKSQVRVEIAFALERQAAMESWYRLVADQVFPLRVTHNDTKFNNVLLDQYSQQAICVIDLDTVMPGVVGYDFGDAIRTIVNTAEEDEEDLAKINVNQSYYRAFAKGFLQELGPFLTQAEKENLAFSANYMTFIMGLRFLTDYLQGDVYYKVQHPEHNLLRARNQFTLVSKLEESVEEINGSLNQLFSKYC